MMLKRLLHGENKGIGAVEFALIAPVLIAFVVGISQMGKLFFANADMKNAMAHGARAASVWPVPESDADIEAVVNARLARTSGLAKADVEIKRGTEDGNDYIDIEMTYQVPLDLIFFDAGPITLSDSRRVFTQMQEARAGEEEEEEVEEGGTTSSTSATSASSTGGTTSSTSATSASSTGGTTSATSASSTTSASTTSSGNGNGNSNGNSNHGHGDCKKKC